MFIRRAFTTFLEARSNVLAPVSAPIDGTPADRTIADCTVAPLTIDWRWFSESEADDGLPSEGSLINWPAWARLTRPRLA